MYNGAPPKYLNDFSKALAGEVRILLAEVGKLRDERRQLQYEIAELMSVKSKHGAGGEYSPEWRPKPDPPPVEMPPLDPVAPPGPAKPAWRTVHKRAERKAKALAAAGIAPPPAAPAPVPALTMGVDMGKPLPAWAQWRPNPLLAPQPTHGALSSVTSPLMGGGRGDGGRSGLFGPPTPPPK